MFLYNIAQCYRILNKNEEALSFYRSYLRRAPEAPNRAEVETKITALQEAIATQEKARTTPKQGLAAPEARRGRRPPTTTANNTLVASAPPPRRRRPVYKKWWLWTAVGAVVVVGVGRRSRRRPLEARAARRRSRASASPDYGMNVAVHCAMWLWLLTS